MNTQGMKEIRVALLAKDITIADVVKEFGTSRPTVYSALECKTDSGLARDIRAYVFNIIGPVGGLAEAVPEVDQSL